MASDPTQRTGSDLSVDAFLEDNRLFDPPDTFAKTARANDPGVYDRAAKLLGREGLAEVLALLGYYSAVAMAMKLHRVPVPG